MRYLIKCKYCGRNYKEWLSSENQLEDLKCNFCGDKDVEVEEIETGDIFGYDSQAPKPDAYIGRRKK